VIRISRDSIVDIRVEGVLRPIRSDLTPVNAASRDLAAAAGEELQERLLRLGALPSGGAVVTPGGDLGADFVIHVVVMSEEEPQTEASLRRAVENGLRRASDIGLESLAMPPLGLGVGVAEPEDAARALLGLLLDHLDEKSPPLDLRIVVSSEYESDLFAQALEELERERRQA
jgi:O-acetyl-ADP-ribose deacetylase (regulator of RNase III)